MVRNVSNPGVFLIVFVSVLSTHTAYVTLQNRFVSHVVCA